MLIPAPVTFGTGPGTAKQSMALKPAIQASAATADGATNAGVVVIDKPAVRAALLVPRPAPAPTPTASQALKRHAAFRK